MKLFWALCPGLEPSTLRLLLRHFGSATALFEASANEWKREVRLRDTTVERMEHWRMLGADRIDRFEGELQAKDISIFVHGDEDYPARLSDLYDPPVVLFLLGDRSLMNSSIMVSVVGTRRASSYGLEVTRWICSAVAARKGVVVSGMALGVDGMGHRAALDAGGKTIAVLGSGVEICYPPSHFDLYNVIRRNGLVVSEYRPEAQVAKHHFPERNRLIAALGDVTIVAQAGEKSGALGTAMSALDIGRDVYAVPGPITSKMFRGSNQLLFDGAIPLVDPEFMMATQFGLSERIVSHVDGRTQVPDHLRALYDVVSDDHARRAGEIAAAFSLEPSFVYAGLLELEVSGLIRRLSDGRYVARQSLETRGE